MTKSEVKTAAYVASGTVVTLAGTDYYVWEAGRAGSLELIRLHDLKGGFNANVYKHNVKPGRQATDEERNRVYDMRIAKLDADAQFRPGALVRVTKPNKHVDPKALYVITKASEKTVSIVVIGGTSNGAYINAPRNLLTLVDPSEVLK